MGERADVEFTVVPAEEVPQELSEILEKNKAREIRMTYQDGEELYLIRGYGEQKTGVTAFRWWSAVRMRRICIF